jgi:hypothetical protein
VAAVGRIKCFFDGGVAATWAYVGLLPIETGTTGTLLLRGARAGRDMAGALLLFVMATLLFAGTTWVGLFTVFGRGFCDAALAYVFVCTCFGIGRATLACGIGRGFCITGFCTAITGFGLGMGRVDCWGLGTGGLATCMYRDGMDFGAATSGLGSGLLS